MHRTTLILYARGTLFLYYFQSSPCSWYYERCQFQASRKPPAFAFPWSCESTSELMSLSSSIHLCSPGGQTPVLSLLLLASLFTLHACFHHRLPPLFFGEQAAGGLAVSLFQTAVRRVQRAGASSTAPPVGHGTLGASPPLGLLGVFGSSPSSILPHLKSFVTYPSGLDCHVEPCQKMYSVFKSIIPCSSIINIDQFWEAECNGQLSQDKMLSAG